MGNLIANHLDWCVEAQALLTEIGEGATAFPPLDGTWRKPDGTDLWEQTRIIYTYINPDRLAANMSRVRSFLHRFGSSTDQGKVVLEFDGWFWGIDKYDPPAGQ
jgi:hypothetical protein